jgi:hypothetical protein
MVFNGIPILTKTGQKACDANSYTLPLNMGSFAVDAIGGGCPQKAGNVVKIDATSLVGKLAPNGALTSNMVAHDKAGNTLYSLAIDVKLTSD